MVEADREDAHPRRLILFAFGGAKQDYDYWLRQPYWARKYGSNSAEAGPDITVEDETAELEGDEAEHPHYGIDNIIEDGCFFPTAFLESALQRLRAKKNLILQGPPGTGKTWSARSNGSTATRTACSIRSAKSRLSAAHGRSADGRERGEPPADVSSMSRAPLLTCAASCAETRCLRVATDDSQRPGQNTDQTAGGA